jgi:hypothetical protein
MKHYCPMCGEQWDEDRCGVCGWHEGKPQRYTASPARVEPTAAQRARRRVSRERTDQR